ncbi:hypothetical protein C8J57DRAFT_1459014 [Mycena rebaudengoi]|nr:hypothetical protein C8J57DRAFT_1459014 [Mycena rebaudengoi]
MPSSTVSPATREFLVYLSARANARRLLTVKVIVSRDGTIKLDVQEEDPVGSARSDPVVIRALGSRPTTETTRAPPNQNNSSAGPSSSIPATASASSSRERSPPPAYPGLNSSVSGSASTSSAATTLHTTTTPDPDINTTPLRPATPNDALLPLPVYRPPFNALAQPALPPAPPIRPILRGMFEAMQSGAFTPSILPPPDGEGERLDLYSHCLRESQRCVEE